MKPTSTISLIKDKDLASETLNLENWNTFITERPKSSRKETRVSDQVEWLKICSYLAMYGHQKINLG